ncbi:MAG: Trp family transcriptional regulator, partial [Candidatus Gottesmanbacteria bacterium]|nr:Trp family transcriptional regulator [Candidatus Gottesmanbacteria bacterium]
MTQISRRPLSKELEHRMFSLFRNALVNVRSEREAADLMDDLLSPMEKIMLGKRLAIAFLLDRGYDQRTIHTVLHVSVTTVNSVNYWLQQKGDGYRRAVRLARREQKWEKFFDGLELVLRGLLSEKEWVKTMRG